MTHSLPAVWQESPTQSLSSWEKQKVSLASANDCKGSAWPCKELSKCLLNEFMEGDSFLGDA